MLFRRYILLFLTLLSLSLQGQQYPVDIQVFATPPYPQSLRGYADTFEEKLQAHFLLKDLSTGGRPFVLRLSLENFQGQVIAQTPDYIAPYLLNLTPGVRRTLSNIDFKSLLKYENLYGINESTYNGLLPEGTYFLCLSLYDSATGRPVSNKGRAMLQVRRYTPPIPTMPQKGEVLTKKNAFQHIVFQWMPRDIAPFMQYEFTLKEVWDLSLVPEEAFMTGRLVYQTQTYAPALAYTNMMPILLENKRYVWQVRAFTNNPNNPNEPSYFKNNGNSETFYFDLVSHCEAPKFLTAISESTSAQLRWSAQAMMPNQEYPYKVMYREKGKSWKSQKVSMPNAKLTGLKRGRTYIYKVGVACGLNATHSSSVFGQESYMYSTEQEFTTTEQIDQKSQVQCGVKPQVHIKNTSPLQDNLYPNTTFTAGDFPVTVLNATGSNGVYSGEGYVKVPYLQDTKIKVSFTNIKLNTEHQLIEGKLITTYDQTERNVQFVQEGIGEVFGDKGKKDQKMPFEIENQNNIQVDSISGRITITGKVDPKTGIAPKVTLPKGRDYVITDSKGKVYQLDENGKVTAQGTREEGTQLAQQAGKGDSKNPPIDNKHFKVEWLFNDELATDLTGDIPYKVLVKGKTSSFELRIQPADTTKYDFFFHTENGVKVEAESKGDGLYKITRKGAFDFAQEELWVVAKEKKDKKGKKEELIGKCVLVHLSPKEVNVALVPTQSGQNLQEAIAQVQQIYEKVGVTLHITTEKPFDISDQLKNGTLPTENEFGDLSTYSPEQNAVIDKFATNRKPKDNTYYIFLVNDGTGDHGYMRLGGQYGFVYSTNARTIAHELGHGIFKLEHPFKGKNADKGKTTALMDYNNGQDFFYHDWKQINDPKVKLYAFQGQKEGENLLQKNSPMMVQRYIEYFRCTRKQKGTIYSNADKVDVYAEDITIDGVKYAKIVIEFLGKNNVEFKNHFSPKDYQNDEKVIHDHSKDKLVISFGGTIRFSIFSKDRFKLINYLYSDNDKHIKLVKSILSNISAYRTEEGAFEYINSLDVCTLSSIDFDTIRKVLKVLTDTKLSLTDTREKAIIRILSSLKEQDFPKFIALLKEDNYKVFNRLYTDLDDAVLFYGNNNYTGFVKFLIEIYKKVNSNTSLSQEIIGELSREKNEFSVILNVTPTNTRFFQRGWYHPEQRKVSVYAMERTMVPIKTTHGQDITPKDIKGEKIGELSPLSYVLIYKTDSGVPLIEEALSTAGSSSLYYAVPAIFLDYYQRKELLDTLEKGAAVTLDIATIASIGSIALATKIHWVHRAWAIAEGVGMVGDIVVNTTLNKYTNNHFVRAVHYYNAAMGAIGLGIGTQMGYRAVKSLPRNAKNNAKLMENYELWQKEVAQLDHLPQAEKQLIDKQRKVWKRLELTNEGKGAENLIKTVNSEQKLFKNGKFIDELLEADYQKYLTRKSKQGKAPKDRLEWKESRDYWLNDSPMARGNEFNKKAWKENWYRYNEVTLENGKRLDSYTPPMNGVEGMIVSRKATNLEEIELSSFEDYLKEIKAKYPIGAKINAPKYGDELKGKVLEGKHYLEIPESNKSFGKLQEYIDLAKNKYDIEIIFKTE